MPPGPAGQPGRAVAVQEGLHAVQLRVIFLLHAVVELPLPPREALSRPDVVTFSTSVLSIAITSPFPLLFQYPLLLQSPELSLVPPTPGRPIGLALARSTKPSKR